MKEIETGLFITLKFKNSNIVRTWPTPRKNPSKADRKAILVNFNSVRRMVQYLFAISFLISSINGFAKR